MAKSTGNFFFHIKANTKLHTATHEPITLKMEPKHMHRDTPTTEQPTYSFFALLKLAKHFKRTANLSFFLNCMIRKTLNKETFLHQMI